MGKTLGLWLMVAIPPFWRIVGTHFVSSLWGESEQRILPQGCLVFPSQLCHPLCLDPHLTVRNLVNFYVKMGARWEWKPTTDHIITTIRFSHKLCGILLWKKSWKSFQNSLGVGKEAFLILHNTKRYPKICW